MAPFGFFDFLVIAVGGHFVVKIITTWLKRGKASREGKCSNWSAASMPWKLSRSPTSTNASACWKRRSSSTMWRYNGSCARHWGMTSERQPPLPLMGDRLSIPES
jgi:hypothetical protein